MKYYFLSILLLALTSCSNTNEQSKPNFVIIFMDDLGYGDIENFGAINYQTPNISNMVNRGMLFTNFYSAQAVCSASRAGLLTGTYPNRIGISGALMPYSEHGLHEDEKTIAEILKEKGYSTGIFGKWHLGHQDKFLPTNHGFDTYLGIPYSNDMWPVDFKGEQISDTSNWRKKSYPQLPLIEDEKIVREIKTLDDQAELTTIFTEKSVDFINENKDNPFFLYVPHPMPHVPIAVSKKFLGKSDQGLYGDLMMEIDWSVGKIINALEQNNIIDNTLIIFTSDNGPWLNFGNHAGSTGGLREGKGTSFEGGQRVPTVMMWPNVIPAGKIANQLSSAIDILPTVSHIVDGNLPKHKIDGINIMEILKGEKVNPRKEFYYYYGNNNLEAVRKDNWKLILPHTSRSYKGVLPNNDGFPGNYNSITTGLELYNLRRDPGEEYDVIKKYPNIAKELEELAEKARSDMGDNLTGRKGINNRTHGKL